MYFTKAVVAAATAVSAFAVAIPEIQTRQFPGIHVGDGTFYNVGLGACGITNTDGDYAAAVSHILFDAWPGYTGSNPNDNPVCGMSVTAQYQGKQVTVNITDSCGACAEFDLNFTPAAFEQLADVSIGRIHDMTWSFND